MRKPAPSFFLPSLPPSLSFSLSFSFNLSFSFPSLSVRTTDCSPRSSLLGLTPSSPSAVAPLRESGAQEADTSAFPSSGSSSIRRPDSRRPAAHLVSVALSCTRYAQLRIPFRRIQVRTSQHPAKYRAATGYRRIGKRSAVLIRHALRFSALKGRQDEGDRASAGWTMRQSDRGQGRSTINRQKEMSFLKNPSREFNVKVKSLPVYLNFKLCKFDVESFSANLMRHCCSLRKQFSCF